MKPLHHQSQLSQQEVSRYVKEGVADAGITGRDWIVENGNAEKFEVLPSDKVLEDGNGLLKWSAF